LSEKYDLPLEGVRCWTDTRSVLDLDLQGSDFIWAATPGGLLRLDRESGLWKVYTMADGLPSNLVLSVLSSSSGKIWAGTDRGIARLEGPGFSLFGTGEGLPSNLVYVLREAPGGIIYAGTGRGIARFAQSRWERVDDTHEFARRAVLDMAVDKDGTLWFAKENALTHQLENGTWETFQRNVLRTNRRADLISNSLLSLAVDGQGVKWIGTRMGLSRYDGRRWEKDYYRERLDITGGLRDNWIEAIAADSQGRIWVAHGHSRDFDAAPGTAYLAGENRWSYLTVEDGLPSNRVYRLKPDPDGGVWLGTALGLAHTDGRKVAVYRTPGALLDNHVISLSPAGESRFMSLTASGPVIFPGAKPKDYPPPNDINFNTAVYAEGRIYGAGGRPGLFAHRVNEGWGSEEYFTEKKVLALALDGEGEVRVTCADGLFLGLAGRWSRVALPELPPGFILLNSFRSPSGELWLAGEEPGTDGGSHSAMLVHREEGLHPADLPVKTLPYPRLNRVIFHPRGDPWLVSPAGLYRHHDGWRKVDSPGLSGSLRSAVWERDDRLWAAVKEGGLFLYDGADWRELLVGGKPSPGGVGAILPREDGSLILGTAAQGLFRLEVGRVLPSPP
jgi:ligand-binding sensor domain-containing protein